MSWVSQDMEPTVMGFQKGSACSNRHGDGFGWIFKGLQLSSQYDPTCKIEYLPDCYRA